MMSAAETASIPEWLLGRSRQKSRLAVAAVLIGLAISIVMLASPNALQGLGIILGMIAAVAALLWPQLAVYALAADIIATWPQSAPKYIGVLLVLAMTWRILTGYARPRKDKILLVMIAFTVLAWISMILSPTKQDITTTAVTYSSFVVMYWAFITLLSSEKLIRNTIVFLVLAGLGAALIGLAQMFLHFTLPTSLYQQVEALGEMTLVDAQGFMGRLRVDSVAAQPVLFAFSLQTVAPFVILPLVSAWRTRNQLLFLALLVCLMTMAAAWTQTYARTSYVAVAVMLIWGASKYGRRAVVTVVVAAALLAGPLLLVSEPIRDRFVSVFTGAEEAGAYMSSVEWRLGMWQVGLQMVADHPLTGVGPGQFMYNFKQYLPNYQLMPPGYEVISPLHNTFLATTVDLGLLGLALFVVMLWLTMRTLWRAQRELRANDRHTMADMAMAVEVAMVGLLVSMLFADLERFRYVWFLIALAGAIGGVATTGARNRTTAQEGT
ncbi:MAG: hypothetical protein EPO21_16295 [Chloroflexota bacterium]|nr:MAG: hypothetical protein EPO21_16295 [Chloroflexota bacterium]